MKQCSGWFHAVLALSLSWKAACGLAAEQQGAEEHQRGVITIDVFQAKKLFDAGVTFIDVRSDVDWHAGHIKNALHLDFQSEFAAIEELEGIDKDTHLVFYCNSSECLSGAYASAISAYWGYRNIYYFRQGYFAWLLLDYPAEMNLSAQKLD